MEKFTTKEKELLRNLQAKEKRISRQEKAFLKDVDDNIELVYSHLNIDKNVIDRLNEIASKYGTDIPTLLDYISTDRQINYFKSIKK
jgi:hypothetical protein